MVKVKVKLLNHVRLFAIPWTVAHQAPPSMGFSREEYWSELPFPSPGDLPDLGIEPSSPALQADSLPPSHQGGPYSKTRIALVKVKVQEVSPVLMVTDCSEVPLQQGG